jgi:hypothetical protein
MSLEVYGGTNTFSSESCSFFQKGIYIKRKLDHDYAYIIDINNEYPNDRKYKIIWASSGQKDLLDEFEIKQFLEFQIPKDIDLCGRCHIPLVQRIAQETQQKFLTCPSYSLSRIGGYCKYPTKTIFDEPKTIEVSEEKVYWKWKRDRKGIIPQWVKQRIDEKYLSDEFCGQLSYCDYGRFNKKKIGGNKLDISNEFPSSLPTKSCP